MTAVLRGVLEGYDSDVYVSDGGHGPRIHKLYRRLGRKKPSRYHALQNSLALPGDGYHEMDLGDPMRIGTSPDFRLLRFRVLRLPEPAHLGKFCPIEGWSRRACVASEPGYVPGPDMWAYFHGCNDVPGGLPPHEAYRATKALCESIDRYFLRVYGTHTHTVDDNVKIERLDCGALCLIITDTAGSIEDCLSRNVRLVEALVSGRAAA